MSKQEYGEGCVVRVPRCSPQSNTKDSRRLFPYRYATEAVLARLSVCCNSWRSRCVECVLIRITIRRRVITAAGLDRNQPGKKKVVRVPCSEARLEYTHVQCCIIPHMWKWRYTPRGSTCYDGAAGEQQPAARETACFLMQIMSGAVNITTTKKELH